MTPPHRQLDPSVLFRAKPLELYRLAKAKYADLSGLGAWKYGGRWNSLGEEAIYTSVEQALTVAERLVHTPKNLIPSNLVLMKIHLSGTWEEFEGTWKDTQTGGSIRVLRSLHQAEDFFASRHQGALRAQPFAIAVPSVILPVWNIVLYPQQLGFWDHVSLESVEPFTFDRRLFPEEAQLETI